MHNGDLKHTIRFRMSLIETRRIFPDTMQCIGIFNKSLLRGKPSQNGNLWELLIQVISPESHAHQWYNKQARIKKSQVWIQIQKYGLISLFMVTIGIVKCTPEGHVETLPPSIKGKSFDTCNQHMIPNTNDTLEQSRENNPRGILL